VISLLLALAQPAIAGSSPWTLPRGHHNVFLGGELGGYGKIPNAQGDPVALSTRVGAAKVFGTYGIGLANGFDVELLLPFERAWVANEDGGFCSGGARPDDWCQATAGLGDVALTARIRLLDEASYRPFTVTARVVARSGQAYASSRHRLTSLGDGTNDVGAGLSVGRTGASKGGAWYRLSLASDFWYRFAVGQVDGNKVPANEVSANIDAIGSPVFWLGLGASAAGFHRLGGAPLSSPATPIGHPLTWVGLRASQVRVGPTVALYSLDGWTLFTNASFTAWSKSAPTDITSFTLGVGRYIGGKDESSPVPRGPR